MESAVEIKHPVKGCGGHLCHKHHAKDADEHHLYSLEHLRGIPTSVVQAPATATLPRNPKKRSRGKKAADEDTEEQQPEKKQDAVAPCTVFPPCPIHCGYGNLCAGCKTHCPQVPTQPIPVPTGGGGGGTVPTAPVSNPPFPGGPTAPMPNQPIVRVTLPSAYQGNVSLGVIDRGNGWYELIATVTNGSRTLVIKTIDAQKNGFNVDTLPLLSTVSQMPPMVVHRDELSQAANVIATLRPLTNRNPTQEAQYTQALNVLAPVQSHFGMQQYMQFLYAMTGFTSILSDNVNFIACICNVPNIDNAFWADYMVICTGSVVFFSRERKMCELRKRIKKNVGAQYFYNFATLDILGHECSHGSFFIDCCCFTFNAFFCRCDAKGVKAHLQWTFRRDERGIIPADIIGELIPIFLLLEFF